MAKRPAYLIENGKVIRRDYDFKWVAGLSTSQNQKCALSLHEAICAAEPGARPLEVSTKGTVPLGISLSAFNLKLNGFTFENVFHSGKMFEHAGPFPDLLSVPPRDAKHDERLRTSGKLVGFRYQDMDFPLEPQTLYFDFIYCKAVLETLPVEEIERIRAYDHFTDIVFNPSKSINTQAKAVAEIHLMLDLYGCIPEMDPAEFLGFHQKYVFA